MIARRMNVSDNHDRFGVDVQLIRNVLEEHRGIVRLGCYVPTRTEVATADPAWLECVLVDWWWESPTALMPTWGQVKDVVAILGSRSDAREEGIQRILAQAPTEADFR